MSRLGFQGYEKQKKLAKNARQPTKSDAHGGGGGVMKVKKRPGAAHSKKAKPKQPAMSTKKQPRAKHPRRGKKRGEAERTLGRNGPRRATPHKKN